jgi:hypothetical protein
MTPPKLRVSDLMYPADAKQPDSKAANTSTTT